MTNEAASEQRKSAASHTSRIVPRRPSGVSPTARARAGPTSRRRTPSVSAIGPGAIPLTRMPYRPHSTASTRVSASTPAFAAETCSCAAVP